MSKEKYSREGLITVIKKDSNWTMCEKQKLVPSGISHSFDTGVAQVCGVDAAIIYNHLAYWINHNKIEGKNFIDGQTWTYNTHEKIAQYLPYFTTRQIKYSLEKLCESGLLIKGNHNKNKFDKTCWYALFDESILFNSKNVCEETNLSDRDNLPRTKTDTPMGQNCPMGVTNLSPLYYTGINQVENNINTCADFVDAKKPSFVEPDKPIEKKTEKSEGVFVTDEEHRKLVEKSGMDNTLAAYEHLSIWKKSANPTQVKKHSSDYYRILKWVMKEVIPKEYKSAFKKPTRQLYEGDKEYASY